MSSALACRADHPRVKHPIVNKDEPRMNTNRRECQWTCFVATTSREEGPPGSAGVPPAQHWHSLTPLSHLARPATARRFRFSRAHGVSTGRVAVCRITGKLSGHPTQRMRARRPRSRRGAVIVLRLNWPFPEGRLLPSFLLREEAQPLPMRQCRPASRAFVVLRVSSWITLVPFVSAARPVPRPHHRFPPNSSSSSAGSVSGALQV